MRAARREGLEHLFGRGTGLGRKFPDARRPPGARRETALRLLDLQHPVLERARNVHVPGRVAHVALQFAEDRRHRVGDERRATARVVGVDGLDEREARDLLEILERLRGVAVARGKAAGQLQVLLDERRSSIGIRPRPQLEKERAGPGVQAASRWWAAHEHGDDGSPDRAIGVLEHRVTLQTMAQLTDLPARAAARPAGEVPQPAEPVTPTEPEGPEVPDPVEPEGPVVPDEPATPADPTPERELPQPQAQGRSR